MRMLLLFALVAVALAHSHDHGGHDHDHEDSNSDVLTLTSSNFKDTIKEKEIVMVEFYAPWCGHCKRLAPEYDQAAHELHGIASLAKVDCTQEKDICSEYGVQGYPTLKLFRNDGSAPTNYDQARKADAIVKFMKKQTQPAYSDIKSADALKEFKGKDDVTVAFFGDASGDAYESFTKVAQALRNEHEFAVVTDSALAKEEGVKVPAVVLYKKFDEGHAVYSGDLTQSALESFISSEAFPLLGEIGPENFQSYTERGLPLAWFFLDYASEAQKAVESLAQKVAAEFKGKLSFVKLDGVKWEQHAKTFGLSTTPGIVIQDMTAKKNYVFPKDTEVTSEALSKYGSDYLKGELQAHVKSEEPPTDNNGPVKVVVGKTFEEIVLDPTKDVFVEFYAPWCGHCKNLAPKYEKLGEEFKDQPSVIIAKVDSTENDTPAEIAGFPTLIFYPANNKKGINYDGDRSVEEMAAFIRKHGTATSTDSKKAGHDEL